MESNDEFIGFLKYKGKLVDEGFMDAKKSAQALLGFDEILRFYIYQQSPSMRNINFDLPVRVKKGSWVIVLPEIIDVVKAAGALIVTAYGAKAAQKMAEKDFDDIGLRDALRISLEAVQWTIKLSKHLGDIAIKKFENLKYKNNNELIGIPNSEGEYIYVPKQFFDYYLATTPKLYTKVSELVEEERVLSIGIYKDSQLLEEKITRKHRVIFTHENEESDDVLFPELKHEEDVILEGEVTRGNEKTNTIGFSYQDHIITCIPEHGSIVYFKPTLFLKCRIHGVISRIDENGYRNSKRPKIIFTYIEPLEEDDKAPLLL